MFEGHNFLIFSEHSNLTLTIENYNGKVFINDSNRDIDFSPNSKTPINHIISDTVNFRNYEAVNEKMIPITTSQWIYDSIEQNKLLPTRKYSPDPRLFLKDCYICVSDDISTSDKEVIYGGVKAFGGSYFDELTRLTTHLITMAIDNDKAIVASSSEVKIKIIKPEWINDCFKLGQKLDETNYFVESHPTQNTTQVNLSDQYEAVPSIYNTKILNGKKLFISSDYQLSKRLKECINSLIIANGGIITKNINDANIYIGKYRQGTDFINCLESKNDITTGNLPWLYSIIIKGSETPSINAIHPPTQILHFPIPSTPLSSFKNLKICISNYEGDARYYLSRLITLLGATFTKSLTKDNDILIVSKPIGKKYEAATKTWLDNNGNPMVNVVNHLWLEECYANWEKLPLDKLKYKSFNGMERLIGVTKLKMDVIKWIVDDSVDDEVLNYSETEPQETQEQNKERKEREEQIEVQEREEPQSEESETEEPAREEPETEEPNSKMDENSGNLSSDVTQASISTDTKEDVSEQQQLQEVDDKLTQSSKDEEESQGKEHIEMQQQIDREEEQKQADGDNTKDQMIMDNVQESSITEQSPKPLSSSQVNTEVGRSKRRAASKAALKLQDDMSDLNNYQQLTKSSRKMKNYMELLDQENIKVKRHKATPEPSTPNDLESSPVKSSVKATTKKSSNSQNSSQDEKLIVVVTGWDELNKDAINKLKSQSILISNDLRRVNTLVAPKILRTEKFLTSLSHVKRILHPNFLLDRSKGLIRDADSYSLDKIVGVKEINQELGIDTEDSVNGIENILINQRPIFKNYKLNLSSNLNGGFEVLSKILKSHGVHLEDLKLIDVKTKVDSYLTNGDNDDIIVVVNSKKDSKLVKNLTNCIIVDWDWCVKSIFKMEIEPYENYSC